MGREGREAAGHSLAQPFLVPLEAGGMPVPSAEVTPLGQYAPKTPQYTNPVAQFIPNVTYVENGDEVVGFEGPEDAAEVAAEEEEATTPEEVAAEQESGEEEPVEAEEKQLNLMRSALRQHSSAAMRIRSKIALLTRAVAHQQLQEQEQIKPRVLNPAAYAHGMQRPISPVYAAPAEVTAGAVQAMQQADRDLSYNHQMGV